MTQAHLEQVLASCLHKAGAEAGVHQVLYLGRAWTVEYDGGNTAVVVSRVPAVIPNEAQAEPETDPEEE